MGKPEEPSSDREQSSSPVRYSEKFLKQRQREERRTCLHGSVVLLICAVGMGHYALRGFRTNEWVNIAGPRDNEIFLPPVVVAILAFGLLGLSVWFFWRYIAMKGDSN